MKVMNQLKYPLINFLVVYEGDEPTEKLSNEPFNG
jgi:hypothetical protein